MPDGEPLGDADPDRDAEPDDDAEGDVESDCVTLPSTDADHDDVAVMDADAPSECVCVGVVLWLRVAVAVTVPVAVADGGAVRDVVGAAVAVDVDDAWTESVDAAVAAADAVRVAAAEPDGVGPGVSDDETPVVCVAVTGAVADAVGCADGVVDGVAGGGGGCVWDLVCHGHDERERRIVRETVRAGVHDADAPGGRGEAGSFGVQCRGPCCGEAAGRRGC